MRFCAKREQVPSKKKMSKKNVNFRMSTYDEQPRKQVVSHVRVSSETLLQSRETSGGAALQGCGKSVIAHIGFSPPEVESLAETFPQRLKAFIFFVI
jgi:hypothetical protein